MREGNKQSQKQIEIGRQRDREIDRKIERDRDGKRQTRTRIER